MTFKFDPNRLKASNDCTEAAVHLRLIVQALGSLISEGEERGNSGFPPHLSAVGFHAHVPEPRNPVTIFQMAAIR